jgi:putative DNA primase/helicase
MTAASDFRDAIAASGLTPPDEIIGDGTKQRFSSNGRRGDKSGWYIFHDDERPAGVFGCWRVDLTVNWKSSAPREFSPQERLEYVQRMKRLEAERAAELKASHEHAAAEAARMWSAAQPSDNHPYLQRKQITGIGARVLGDELLIPMKHSAKELVGLQRIYPDSQKRFIKGSPLAGAYCTLGKPTPTGCVAIVEGYATGVSVHLATGYCVVVAFNAGNLEPVAKKIRAALPQATIIIGADDDAWTDGNPGITSATAAAKATGSMIAIPRWYGDRPEKHTDFNDLHADEGMNAVAECFHGASNPIDPGSDRSAADQVQPAQPLSGGENSGSSEHGGAPSPADATVHDEPGHPVILPGPSSDVGPLVDYYGWLPNVNDKGKPLSTIENVQEICRRLNITVRYNVISKEEEILIPGAGFSLDNRQNASLAWVMSECAKFRMPVDRVPDFITYLGDQNLYNPVAQWVTSKPWDGMDRLSQLIATVKARGEDHDFRIMQMKTAFITRWMISAIAGAFRPTGVSAHGVLVFQGAQYVGKTKWFKQLVPQELGLLKDGMLLRPDDRDSVMKCVSNWLVELGEIDATFRKSDVAALKSFLTSDRDVLRRAYARKESAFARRTVFFASVNPKNYLHDETGNRRYWTIECEELDHSHGIDMQQCWAQVHQLWADGESWFLQPGEMDLLNEHNKEFEVIDPIEDLISNGLAWKDPQMDWKWRTATEVLVTLGRNNCSKSDVTKAGTIIRNMNGGKSKRTGQSRLLLVPDTFRTPLN